MILSSAPSLNEKPSLSPPSRWVQGGVKGGCVDCLRTAETIDMDALQVSDLKIVGSRVIILRVLHGARLLDTGILEGLEK